MSEVEKARDFSRKMKIKIPPGTVIHPTTFQLCVVVDGKLVPLEAAPLGIKKMWAGAGTN
jgi:hypothetical protein